MLIHHTWKKKESPSPQNIKPSFQPPTGVSSIKPRKPQTHRFCFCTGARRKIDLQGESLTHSDVPTCCELKCKNGERTRKERVGQRQRGSEKEKKNRERQREAQRERETDIQTERERKEGQKIPLKFCTRCTILSHVADMKCHHNIIQRDKSNSLKCQFAFPKFRALWPFHQASRLSINIWESECHSSSRP